MALQNRLTPYGEIVSVPQRGLFMGNRGGRIHDCSTKTLTKRRWASRQWICCVTKFKERHRAVMGRSYTELFFLDEVTALAAGHRPCFECRRKDALAFASAWARVKHLSVSPKAPEMDRCLHRERSVSGAISPRSVDIHALPNGAIIEIADAAWAVKGEHLLRWSHDGYQKQKLKTTVTEGLLLTPAIIVDILRQGYLPYWHPSAEHPSA